MALIKFAAHDVRVALDLATRQPRMIVVDAADPSDPAFRPEGCAVVSVPCEIYNQGLHDAHDPHALAVAYARRKLESQLPGPDGAAP
jgi:hypothetical protein